MSDYCATPSRISEPRNSSNLCGDCGDPVSETELLCETCRIELYLVNAGPR
jgi:predicted amidophosphoribosyltransferase